MNSLIKKLFAGLGCTALLFVHSLIAFAEVKLPEGTVAGLPEKLTVMDSDGNAVSSDTGEYFFSVENMIPNEAYSKDVQIMNLREDKAYHIYFYAEPLSRSGEIDLENDCTAIISLDGQQVYSGKVTGEGNINLTEIPIDLGLYEPGQSRKLNCTVTWNGESAESFIDYGKKIVDVNGTTVVKEGSGDGYIYGEVIFKWIFYAVVDEDYVPPKTGVFSEGTNVYAVILSAIVAMTVVMAVLILVKKRKNKNRRSSE